MVHTEDIKVALVTIAKNEDRYIEEYIDYHIKLGFNHVYLYCNDWEPQITRPNLTKTPFNGRVQQLNAYNHAINNYKNDYDYIAFFDADEFLVLHKHQNIQQLLEEYNPTYGIAFNWYFFGSNGRLTPDGNSLIKQYTYRQKDVNEHVKCIINPKKVESMVNPHYPNKPLMDTNRNSFTGPFNPNGPTDVAQINHYYYKSKLEWGERCVRGRIDCMSGYDVNKWDEQKDDLIDIEDLSAIRFFYE